MTQNKITYYATENLHRCQEMDCTKMKGEIQSFLIASLKTENLLFLNPVHSSFVACLAITMLLFLPNSIFCFIFSFIDIPSPTSQPSWFILLKISTCRHLTWRQVHNYWDFSSLIINVGHNNFYSGYSFIWLHTKEDVMASFCSILYPYRSCLVFFFFLMLKKV